MQFSSSKRAFVCWGETAVHDAQKFRPQKLTFKFWLTRLSELFASPRPSHFATCSRWSSFQRCQDQGSKFGTPYFQTLLKRTGLSVRKAAPCAECGMCRVSQFRRQSKLNISPRNCCLFCADAISQISKNQTSVQSVITWSKTRDLSMAKDPCTYASWYTSDYHPYACFSHRPKRTIPNSTYISKNRHDFPTFVRRLLMAWRRHVKQYAMRYELMGRDTSTWEERLYCEGRKTKSY